MTQLRKEGECSKCLRIRIIVNQRHILCQECNYERLHGHAVNNAPIRSKRYNDKFAYSTEWGYSSEMDMFKDIWDNRPHVSQVSGHPIPEAAAHNFAHVLAKGINKYPHLRLCPWGVYLLTMKEHHLWDNGSEEQRRQYAESINKPECWDEITAKAEELKEYYKLKFGP